MSGPHAMDSLRLYRRLAILLLILVLTAGVFSVAGAVKDAQPVHYVWTAPTEGSPVVFYRVQLSRNDGEFAVIDSAPTTSYTLAVEWGDKYVIRVAGVDAADRQGPYSIPSEPYTPEIPPPSDP